MYNEKFWLALAFLLFLFAFLRYALPHIISALDKQSKKIADEINQVKELKEKAQKLFIEAQEVNKEAHLRVSAVKNDIENEVKKILVETKKGLDEELSRKMAIARDKLALEEKNAIREIRQKIIQAAIDNVATDSQSSEVRSQFLEKILQEVEKS